MRRNDDLEYPNVVGSCSSVVLQDMITRSVSRVVLLTSQVKFNVFERKAEKTGLLQLCRDLNVTVVAHSPLQQGLLTGA